MLIKELSLKTGASIRSIRYYEAKKLLHSRRQDNGYREYDPTAVNRVKIIQLYLSLGLTTDEIVQIIECPASAGVQRPLCREAYELYKAKLAEVDRTMAILRSVQVRLQERIVEFEGRSDGAADTSEEGEKHDY